MTAGQPNIERLINQEQTKLHAEQARKNGRAAVTAGMTFETVDEDHYRLSLPAIGVVFDVDRLRRERSKLVGELSVRCGLPGANVVDGTLSIADFNLSSARARSDRAKLLALRGRANDIDWLGLVEELCQRVLHADRIGQPAVDLRTLPAPTQDDFLDVEGLRLVRRHPTVLFGDGGVAKSYLALFLAGRLAESGLRVGLFDWELAGDDHRIRLERLFPDGMPRIMYCRCDRPLVYEVDRLRRIVREHQLDYLVYDSVAFACDGPPEAAEVAGRYFRAVRQIGVGSLQIAHVTKGENADQRPFGSTFWHNGARATWYVKADESAGGDTLPIGLFNRKANLGRKQRAPLGYRITFSDEQTTFKRMDVADSPDLADKLSVRQRMAYLLRGGAMTINQLAEEIEAKPETIERTAYRNKGSFIVMDGGRVGLVENRLL